jgi:hypothetical protein
LHRNDYDDCVCGYGNRFATKSEKNFCLQWAYIIISNDNNQSEVTLVPISKNRTLSQFDVVEGSAIQAIASKAGIIRTENAFEGIFKGVGRL